MAGKCITHSEFHQTIQEIRDDLRSEIEVLHKLFMGLDSKLDGGKRAADIAGEAKAHFAHRRRIEHGLKLRAIREALYLDQHKFAKRFGFTQAMISMMERGERSAAKLIRKIELESTRTACRSQKEAV